MRLWSSIPRRKRFRISIRAAFLLVGVIATYAATILFGKNLYYWAILPTVLILIAAIVEFVFGDVITEQRYPARTETLLNNYETKVKNVHNQLLRQLNSAIQSLEGCYTNKVNGTLHLIVELFSPSGDSSHNAFVQITSYTGQLGGMPWRFADVSKGIIGRCYRTRKAEYVNFSSQEEYNKRMIREFGYSLDEMKHHTMIARSYWAQPLFSSDLFLGVMYLFSTEPQVFPRAADIRTLEGIASNIVGILEAGTII